MLNSNEFKGRFGFGTMRLPMRNGEPDFELCNQMFDHFLNASPTRLQKSITKPLAS